MRRVVLLTLGVMLMLPLPVWGQGQGLDPATRAALERDLAKAKRTHQYLAVADRFARAGHSQQAKQVVDRAAREARTAWEWSSVANAYAKLGYTENAEAAKRKARDLSR